MNTWRYFDITHRHHAICNPSSIEKLDELAALLRLDRTSRVLDIACGKGELLVRLAERYGAHGVGVDLSPYHFADARAKLAERAPDATIELIEMNGADYRPPDDTLFDCTFCLGASWIWGGYDGTLAALASMTAPGGWVVSGEPFWKRAPDAEYLAALGAARATFDTHAGNALAGPRHGLELAHAIVSSDDEWDRYEGLQWYAAGEWAEENPDDPDREALLARVHASRDAYLRWGRDTLGWAIYLFKKEHAAQ